MATLTFNVRTVEDMIKALECLPPKFDVGKLKIVADEDDVKAYYPEPPSSDQRSEFMNCDADNPIWTGSIFGC